jgi:metal-responsive CopG/Arc/MetJ family transcriptional regulator
MAKQKATISIPDDLMTRVDMLGSLLQMSRSQIVEAALLIYLDGKVPTFGNRKDKDNSRTTG